MFPWVQHEINHWTNLPLASVLLIEANPLLRLAHTSPATGVFRRTTWKCLLQKPIWSLNAKITSNDWKFLVVVIRHEITWPLPFSHFCILTMMVLNGALFSVIQKHNKFLNIWLPCHQLPTTHNAGCSWCIKRSLHGAAALTSKHEANS